MLFSKLVHGSALQTTDIALQQYKGLQA